MIKAVIFDADGVLALPEEFFMRIYARSHGLDERLFDRFFKEIFPAALLGEADLKDLIRQNQDIWQHGTPDAILDQWLKYEDIRNEEALSVIRRLRARGCKCYLATNQEKYRGKYMREVMFKGLFDGYFISCEMGVKKPSEEFFEKTLARLRKSDQNLVPEEIVFFDDTQSHVVAAKNLGMDAILYTGVEQIKERINASYGKL